MMQVKIKRHIKRFPSVMTQTVPMVANMNIHSSTITYTE